jgi:hypothetical protein
MIDKIDKLASKLHIVLTIVILPVGLLSNNRLLNFIDYVWVGLVMVSVILLPFGFVWTYRRLKKVFVSTEKLRNIAFAVAHLLGSLIGLAFVLASLSS